MLIRARRKLVLCVLLVATLSSPLSVLADDLDKVSRDKLSDALAQNSNVPGQGNNVSSNSVNKSSSSAEPFGPAMIPGVCVGTAVGLPVCLVRRFAHNVVAGARGMLGDSENPALVIPAAAIWSPLAFCVSVMESPVYAVRNAWMADKPFSKDQFSLGEMPDFD